MSNFSSLGLSEPIVVAVAREGYVSPTPIQSAAIPHVLAGKDLLGCAQTGTGKTAAFALPILQRLLAVSPRSGYAAAGIRTIGARPAQRRHSAAPRALVLGPTRELAGQIAESFGTYGRGTGLRFGVVFGGVSQVPQVRALQQGVDVLLATPGRLIDLLGQGHVDLRAIEILVLDEADRMLDMGFIHDIRRIVSHVPRERQTLLFSATMPKDIRSLANSILRQPVEVHVDAVSSTARSIAQTAYLVARADKSALLRTILAGEASGRTLVFTRTKHGADRVVRDLVRSGVRAAAIHGNKSQNARLRALNEFKSASPPVLVATDIASRGIDVDDVAHVVNYDLPAEPETYVHRIGRTGRAGASGAAISFCDPDERQQLRAIERLTGAAIEMRSATGGHAAPAAAAHATRAAQDGPRDAPTAARLGAGLAKPASGHHSRRHRRGRSRQRMW